MDAHTAAKKLLQTEKRKKRRQTERTKQARRLRWMDEHPESPVTIKFREQAFATADVRARLQQAKEAKRARMLANRLSDSMGRFCARFQLSDRHPAGIVPVGDVATVKEYADGWKACFKRRRIPAQKVIATLRGMEEPPEPLDSFEARSLGVRLTHSLDRVTGYLVPRDKLHETLGFKVPALAVFLTAGEYVALFVVRTGIIVESARTFEKIIIKLKRKTKQEWNEIFETTRNTPKI